LRVVSSIRILSKSASTGSMAYRSTRYRAQSSGSRPRTSALGRSSAFRVHCQRRRHESSQLIPRLIDCVDGLAVVGPSWRGIPGRSTTHDVPTKDRVWRASAECTLRAALRVTGENVKRPCQRHSRRDWLKDGAWAEWRA
jgi:hypothetical protein